jgi:predicted TPR repeat methyltransferase
MTAVPSDHARVAYDALAPGYDALTGWHDHDAWTALAESCARDAGLAGRRLLDVACGTGNTILPMLERGYDVTGVDVSSAMVAEARRKSGGRARLLVADMRELPPLGAFDLVWCLGDALNYLQTREELRAAFAGFRRNLAPGGVVVFDVNTLATFRTLYTSLLAVPEPDQVVLVEGRGSRDVAAGGSAIAWIDRLQREETGWWTRTRTEHHHRHHPESELRAALEHAGLACVDVRGTHITGTADASLDELRHGKALYTARNGAPRSDRRR